MEIDPMTDIANDAPVREREFTVDIEDLVEAIARRAIEGYEPVPHRIVKELGRNNNMCDSMDLVAETVDLNALFVQIFDAACSLIDEWGSAESGLWWPATKPDAP
jgi:hypothetical protein